MWDGSVGIAHSVGVKEVEYLYFSQVWEVRNEASNPSIANLFLSFKATLFLHGSHSFCMFLSAATQSQWHNNCRRFFSSLLSDLLNLCKSSQSQCGNYLKISGEFMFTSWQMDGKVLWQCVVRSAVMATLWRAWPVREESKFKHVWLSVWAQTSAALSALLPCSSQSVCLVYEEDKFVTASNFMWWK